MAAMLFLDDWPLCLMHNVRRTLGRPVWVPEATLVDPLTEGTWNFPCVWQEADGGWHALYGAALPDGPRRPEGWLPRSQGLMYACSGDGLHWRRPDIRARRGLCERDDAPNLAFAVAGHIDGGPAFRDAHDPDPARRFKYLFSRDGRQGLATSPDGLAWTIRPEVVVGDYTLDSPITAFFNHHRGTYCISRRPHCGDRRIAFFETADWMSFRPPELVIHPDPEDPPLVQFYGMPVHRYEDLYLGLLWRLHCHPTEEPVAKGMGGPIDCALAYSLDGWRFQRAGHQAFIPVNERGRHGGGCIYCGAMAVGSDHVIRFYSGGSKAEHFLDQEQDDAALLLHTLRLDGFARLESCAGTGRVMTRSVEFLGGDLRLNVRAPHGRVRVAVRHDDGGPVPGMAWEDCVPCTGDELFWRPSWRGGAGTAALAGRGRFHLDIELSCAELYAIRGDFRMAYGWGRERAPLAYTV
ncbi:MAG: hypothetical protein L6R48_16815 [Planctomycetes bacterium]|nr:hypothetical protein [Planctomycetota bacterium]